MQSSLMQSTIRTTKNAQRPHEKVSDLRGDVFDTIKSQLKVAVGVGIGILLISSGFI